MADLQRKQRLAEPTYCPLVVVVSALASGIALDRSIPLPPIFWFVSAVVAVVLWLTLWLLNRGTLASWTLLTAALTVGGGWHHTYWRFYANDDISRVLTERSRPICVEAIAIQSPRWVPAPPPSPLWTIPQTDKSELLVWITSVRDGQVMLPASGSADLDVGGFLEHVRAGDRVRIMAQGSRSAAPLNPGEFDFATYQRARRLNCRLFAEFPESVTLLERGSLWSPRRWLANLRRGGSDLLRQYIVPHRATLASAVLLGTREQLDPTRNEDYLVTGTIHVLSISGLHVGILAAGFFIVLRTGLVPRRITLMATIALTIGYALLTDLEPPVVRASILVITGCLALWTGRSSFGFNALAAAGIAVLALNPASLFLTGPQLSFLAVATMIAFQSLLMPVQIDDPLDRLIARTRPFFVRASCTFGDGIWRLWLTGALIWIVSTPLVWKQYHLISPVALVLNFLMWLPVTIAMYSGLGTLLFGSFAPFAGRWCGIACDGSLNVLERMIGAGRDWPAAYFWLASPPGWWIGLFYVALAALFVFPAIRPRWHSLAGLMAMWFGGALVLSGTADQLLPRLGERPLACHFVAVGHGVCVLVELPDGRNLLYDAGRLGSPLAGVRPISSVLWSRGITRLNALVISHADADHFNAIPGLLERFAVDTIYVSPVMFNDVPPAVRELRDAIRNSGVTIREVSAGQSIAADKRTRLEVLHPPETGVRGSDNANSIVLFIEYAGRRLLLTGDLESPGLEQVLDQQTLDFDLVLAPHHGSPRSSPGRFADWCRPDNVVISGRLSLGDEQTLDSVKNSFRLRGAEVFHTAEDGCVTFEISDRGLAVSTVRPHVRAAFPTEPAAVFLQSE